MSRPVTVPSRSTRSLSTPPPRSTVRRLTRHALGTLRRVVPAPGRRRSTDVLATSADVTRTPAFAVSVDQFSRRLSVTGDFDVCGVGPFAGAAAALTAGRRGDVSVDLDGTRFIDAAGLGALVLLRNGLLRGGHQLQIDNASTATRRVFQVGGLGELLPEVA